MTERKTRRQDDKKVTLTVDNWQENNSKNTKYKIQNTKYKNLYPIPYTSIPLYRYAFIPPPVSAPLGGRNILRMLGHAFISRTNDPPAVDQFFNPVS